MLKNPFLLLISCTLMLLYNWTPYSCKNLGNLLGLVHQLSNQKKDLYAVLNATHQIRVTAFDKQTETNKKLADWVKNTLASNKYFS